MQKGQVVDARDWLVPIDDMVVHRVETCTVCGMHGVAGKWTVYEVGAVAVATLVCFPCQRKDPHQTQLMALLDARYASK
jgi:hypothetical protein